MGARSSSAKIWGWAVTWRTCLNGSIIPTQGPAHSRCKVSCHGTKSTCIVGSSVILWGQLDSGESCIMLQSRPTCSLIRFPQHSVITCSTRILCCRGRTLRTRPRTGVCEPLMPDVMGPKVHQRSQVCELSGPTFGFTMWEFSMVDGYTENPEKPQIC